MLSVLTFDSLPFFPTVQTNTRFFIAPYFYPTTTGIAFARALHAHYCNQYFIHFHELNHFEQEKLLIRKTREKKYNRCTIRLPGCEQRPET